MKKRFYSNGKLLLSGEYAILDGARGLAIPTSYGQSLQVGPTNSGLLEWKSYDENQSLWFTAVYKLESLELVSTSDQGVASLLQKLLRDAKTQNPLIMGEVDGLLMESDLSFPRTWGLGSSSTLINNLAQWARVDPYGLLWNSLGGSGYDIACARHHRPINYRLKAGRPEIREIDFNPPFRGSLYFVHLNQKQSSKEAIAAYRNRVFDKESLVHEIDQITHKMVSAPTLSEFEILMERHEEILSKILGIPPVKQQVFPDHPGAIKSLGAWGGDFILATGDQGCRGYFEGKGYPTVIPYTRMIL